MTQVTSESQVTLITGQPAQVTCDLLVICVYWWLESIPVFDPVTDGTDSSSKPWPWWEIGVFFKNDVTRVLAVSHFTSKAILYLYF